MNDPPTYVLYKKLDDNELFTIISPILEYNRNIDNEQART